MMRFTYATTILVLAAAVLPPYIMGQAYSPAKPYGETKLVNDFICSEVTYPDAALEQGQEGNVTLVFHVKPDGTVTDIRIKESISEDLDREALRVFRLLQWEPAIRLGNPVESEEEFTIKFNIKKYNRNCKQRGYEKSAYPYLPVDTSLQIYDRLQLSRAPEPIFDDKSMSLAKFITANLAYPEAAYKQNISGEVELSFVVETHGRPSNIIIEKPLGGGCTEEAIRILKLIRWMPGIMRDQAVRSRTYLTIAFKLPNESDMRMFDNNQGGI